MGIDNNWINHYKVDVLKYILSQINQSIQIKTSNIKYCPENTFKDENTFTIDCRDSSDECSFCDLKINFDGKFGLINFNPTDNIKNIESNYKFGNSRYYADIFAGIVCNCMYSNVQLNNKTKFVIDLDYISKENFHEVK